jgi:tight adherence protein C
MLAPLLGLAAATAVVALAGPHAMATRRSLPDARRLVRADTSAAGRPRPRSLARLAPKEIAAAGLGALVLGLVTPPLALVAVGTPFALRLRSTRARDRAAARDVSVALPDAIDLLLLCAGAGLSLPLAHPLVATRAPEPVGAALRASDVAAEAGGARADALIAALVPLGDRAAALAHVLADHLRYGVPLVPGLERLELELRIGRRRRAEEEIRRVPLRLLAPLLCCVLPAFGLLTVVPLLVASLRSLPT